MTSSSSGLKVKYKIMFGDSFYTMEGPKNLEDEEVIEHFIENEIKDLKGFIKNLFCASWEEEKKNGDT